ncbi:MAG: Zn-dependent alcohol dehydrogenase [Chloroflexi bacterium]|nr:Zn-dependent alcohol dehydrogenase [Chloroflexota bacterium]
MKAAVLRAPNAPLTIEQVDLDTNLLTGEVLVRITHAGVCHSDYHIMIGETPHPMPVVLGHEGAGIVEAVGPGVSRLHKGDPVAVTFRPFCGYCRQCNSGHPNLCDNVEVLRRACRLSQHGERVYNFIGVSCFAEYTVVHESAAIKVPSDVPLDRAALVSCGVMTGVGAVINTAKVSPGETVAVIGCGGVGLNVIQGARLANASVIIAVDIHDNKLEMATTFGATHLINGRSEDAIKKVRELVKGGVDWSFEVIGLPATMEQAYAMIRKGGTAVMVGMPPSASKVSFPAFSFFAEEKTVKGSMFGSARPSIDIPRVLDLYKHHQLQLDELISRHYPLERINEAYEALARGEVARSVIDL